MEMIENFTKNDLRSGQFVKTREDSIYLVIKDCETLRYGHQEFCLIQDRAFVLGSGYKDDLTHTEKEELDIIKVCHFNINGFTYKSICEPLEDNCFLEGSSVLVYNREDNLDYTDLNCCINSINEEIRKLQDMVNGLKLKLK